MKNVIITGGSRGLGLGIARTLARVDFNVVVIARSMGSSLQDLMTERGNVHFIEWDLSRVDTFSEFAQHFRRLHGSLYGLVNNAGIGTAGILSTMPELKIQQLLQMNVLSPMLLTKYLIRPMMAAQAGRVVNISSIVASTGYPGLSVYSASKAALVGFTRSLAREVGPLGITVNAVAPGFIDTEMTHDLNPKQREQIKRRSALQRMASTDDIGSSVQFLMSDSAANITGTVLTVDAGNTA
jgi:3-oxoacyl-[acyl-carrier protein] reductase